MSNKEQHITSIGGQAVMEGVMMRGPYKTAVAVRKPDGDIECKVEENGTKTRSAFFKLPIVRGCVNFIDSLVIGMKALMYSAEFVDLEEEEGESESKFDKWLDDKFGDKIKDIVIYVSIAISLVFSVLLFMILPTFLTRGAEKLGSLLPAISAFTDSHLFTSLFEGIVRMVIFIGYLALVSNMKDIKRVFQYHGAEHKTIACYEAGEELTVENIKKFERFHPRCGTSFLLFVMIVSILLFALLPRVDMIILRVAMRLALLPVVAGISYEIIKWAGRSKNVCVTCLSKPGLWLQKLTTREPDESMIEVAIASMEPCIPDNKEDDRW
ncbi:MAG: DUF1385 domain-containing protein [Oscillospiraceae bacterium]|nr:DUF1385 domain-containing protein [Oscillospiraceae bacterium]